MSIVCVYVCLFVCLPACRLPIHVIFKLYPRPGFLWKWRLQTYCSSYLSQGVWLLWITIASEPQAYYCLMPATPSRFFCSDSARHFSNRREIYEVAKVVHGNRSDNHCNGCNGCFVSKHPPPSPQIIPLSTFWVYLDAIQKGFLKYRSVLLIGIILYCMMSRGIGIVLLGTFPLWSLLEWNIR